MTAEHENLIARIEAVIGRAKPSTVAEWRHCAVRFGVESASAKGALLQAVREIWDWSIYVEATDDGWLVGLPEFANDDGRSLIGWVERHGQSELDLIVHALEAAL